MLTAIVTDARKKYLTRYKEQMNNSKLALPSMQFIIINAVTYYAGKYWDQ